MKISELIVELQRFMDIQGDLDVNMYDSGCGDYFSVDNIKLSFLEDEDENIVQNICEIG
tara:strand:- start:288 stop:464 length:177 start_codon:yes stop_codon:yes gene_type:complete